MSEQAEIKAPKKTDHVIVVDSYGVRHNGIVTNSWNLTINAVYVTPDDSKTDSYGNQTERQTSCVHKSLQAAPGYFWMWPEEAK